jgi:hypothetical protein
MNFGQALELMKNQKYATRKHYAGYALGVIVPSRDARISEPYFFVGNIETRKRVVWYPMGEDLLAEDWEEAVIPEPKPTVDTEVDGKIYHDGVFCKGCTMGKALAESTQPALEILMDSISEKLPKIIEDAEVNEQAEEAKNSEVVQHLVESATDTNG